MKRNYETVELEVLKFSFEDVVATSVPTTPEDMTTPGGIYDDMVDNPWSVQ